MTQTDQINYGETVIEYNLRFSARRKTMQISIHPEDLRVEVIAPRTADRSHIAQLVHKKARWILRKKEELATYQPQMSARQYVAGEIQQYLGRSYQLRLRQGKHKAIVLHDDTMEVIAPNHTPAIVEAIIEGWYRQQAKTLFMARMEVIWPLFEAYQLTFPNLRVRKMKTRWGSCSTKGNVNLNLRLIQAPVDCIDYVIVHEFCHLIEMNHSPRFYRLMDKMMPNWRVKKEKLNKTPVSF